jgi:hypothetical protein
MVKVMVPPGAEDTMTIGDILKPFSIEDDATIQVAGSSTKVIEDTSNTLLASLPVKHGSLITIQSSTSSNTKKPTESRFSQLKVEHRSWDPFPDLAKDYEHALLKSKTQRASSKSMSYKAIAQLQSALHVVEAQPEGPLKRVYMCRYSAERFHVNGMVKKKEKNDKGGVLSRVGLLLGTVQRERVDKSPRKARTSLSSQVSGDDFCTVAKVQAVWEPSGQTTTRDIYDTSIAESLLAENQNSRVLELAKKMDLVPVGWIFSHPDVRHERDDALPVYGLDVKIGGTLQIANMKSKGLVDGKIFATLAMDANTGATEAFQLSDVSVQMVHEGNIVVDSNSGNRREVPTKHNIIINGKETKTLDSVLCLVNTAMLSHEGAYAGSSAVSSVKKNGSLTNKAKKTLLGLLDDDRQLLQELCDFNSLLALDQLLPAEDSESLCQSVKKWARGQKQGTQVDSKVKLRLRSVLET